MSWLARSLVNSLRGDTNGGDRDPPYGSASADRPDHSSPAAGEGRSEDDPLSPTRGVKEDITELTKTISRQFWGVASFLAPPPTTNVTSPDSSPSGGSRRVDPSDPVADEGEVVVSPRIAGIRSDFAELGGRFRSGISILSSTKAVSEISKIASTFLPFGEDETEEEEDGQPGGGGGVVGVTEDVLLFVRNISMHPETWLDFPLIAEDEDSDDFEMSDAQQEHALAVERFEPRLAALRIELCPSHMSEGCFWKIYFVLLHSRLDKYDAELLSTPQIVQARALLLQDLRSRKPINDESARSSSSVLSSEKQEQHDQAVEGTVTLMPISGITSENLPSTAQPAKGSSLSIPVMDIETEKYPVETTELKIIDKPVIEEGPTLKAKSKDLHTDAASIYEDDWLEDETGEVSGSGENTVPLGNDEDVSFSDLEEDDDHGIGAESKATSKSTTTQVKESRGWVQLNSSSGSAEKRSGSTILQNKDGNDWLNVDEVDVE